MDWAREADERIGMVTVDGSENDDAAMSGTTSGVEIAPIPPGTGTLTPSRGLVEQIDRDLQPGWPSLVLFEKSRRAIRSGVAWLGKVANWRGERAFCRRKPRAVPMSGSDTPLDRNVSISGTPPEPQVRGGLDCECRDLSGEMRTSGSSDVGSLDHHARELTRLRMLDSLFGIENGYDQTADGWSELVHSGDCTRFAGGLAGQEIGKQQTIDDEGIAHQAVEVEQRTGGTGGQGSVAKGPRGGARGIIEDLAECKRAEIQLHDSEERYRETLEQAEVGILHSSFEGKILRCNSRFCEIIGYSSSEVAKLTFQRIIQASDLGASFTALKLVASGDNGNLTCERRCIRKDGALTWVRLTTSLLRDSEGRASQLITIVEDINARKAAEQRLAAALAAMKSREEHYRTLFRLSMDAVTISRVSDGHYVEVNNGFLNAFGYERDEVLGRTALELGIWADLSPRKTVNENLHEGAVFQNVEAQFRKKNGTTLWGLISASEIELDGIPCVFSVIRDISAVKGADERLAAAADALRTSEKRYRTVFQTSLDCVTISGLIDGTYFDVNRAFLDLLGYEHNEIVGKTSIELRLWEDHNDREAIVEQLRQNSNVHDFKARFRKRSGEIFWVSIAASVIEIEGEQCVLSVMRDISKAKVAEDRIWDLAFYDSLTRLPNRCLLVDKLCAALTSSAATGRMVALLFVDLDNFKKLNDTYGHQAGDVALREVAHRITSCVRDIDTVARLGGDEFVVMLEDLSEDPEHAGAEAKAAGERILAAVDLPYVLDGHECISTASIGISVFWDHKESADEVLQKAELAMYQAKAAGRDTIRIYSPALQDAVTSRAAMEEDLRHAIRSNQFLLYYQSQVEADRLVGAEALLRWNHPKRGILGPDEFILLAEETGLILPLGTWVIETACAQIAAWANQKQTADITVSVNISALQFRQPEFVDKVLSALRRSGANPKKLRLELTESMLVNDVESTITKMGQLIAHGLTFSLDDFGTGYSSLSYLKRLPLDQLKIDKSFIRDLLADNSSGAIAQAIIALGRAMGLGVIAEGVETDEQRTFLSSMGCDSFQGYLFSRPQPIEEFQTSLTCRPKSLAMIPPQATQCFDTATMN